MPTPGFEEQLVTLMPKLRGWAMAMTRNRAAADDLVQDVAANALSARNSFELGTNFPGWIRRIMVNRFITNVRSQRHLVDEHVLLNLHEKPAHEDRAVLRELAWAVDRLPADQKEALVLIALNEESYENASKLTGAPVGTLKSRVYRARSQLRAYVDRDTKEAA